MLRGLVLRQFIIKNFAACWICCQRPHPKISKNKLLIKLENNMEELGYIQSVTFLARMIRSTNFPREWIVHTPLDRELANVSLVNSSGLLNSKTWPSSLSSCHRA
ncbi:hypothetical protein OIU79_025609, partial [Salix purpurea]